jgi:type II secretory pathway component GspD/PulD (secretin)
MLTHKMSMSPTNFMTRNNRKHPMLRSKVAFIALFCSLLPSAALVPAETEEVKIEKGHNINFNDVPIIEFIRFVSRISQVNFIFDNKELEFNVTFSTGKPLPERDVLKALIEMLRIHGFAVSENNNYHVIHRVGEGQKDLKGKVPFDRLIASPDILPEKLASEQREFFLYKLKYHQGSEIEGALKKIAADLEAHPDGSSHNLLSCIRSLQWVKATNSLLCSGDEETVVSLRKLVDTLDVPLRQVFIEVLVIETDVKKASEFGLEWAIGGKYQDKLGFGMGNFPARGSSAFADAVKNTGPSAPPTGLNQIPLGRGFDMGVIGDIIMHKGKSFLTLGSLVSALQVDGDSTIVLNQKIITQDNKNSKIFVGDNIPFTGSVVQTVGSSQQTTSNIEYRDIGVSLSITPMLGEEDIITLDLDEEITESVSDDFSPAANANGIRTTKTNMATHVHVPDKHFLVLSGMIRNSKSHHKSGIPCLGGLPVIGAAFSKTKQHQEKRNIIVFVRPHIIHSFEDYKKITENQEEIYKVQGAPGAFEEGVKLVSGE